MNDFPQPKGFVRLATQNCHDAALLRASTELFVQASAHDRDEIRRFEDLALHLIPRVSRDDRVYVSTRLAVRIDVPQAVARVLARDEIEVATPILRHSPVLGPLDLLMVIAATGVEHHRLIAERAVLGDDTERALRIGGDAEVAAILDRRRVPEKASQRSATDEAGEAASSPEAKTVSRTDRLDPWVFLSRDPKARLRLLAEIAVDGPEHATTASGTTMLADRAFRSILGAAQIVGFSRSGNRQALVDTIVEGLDLAPDLVAACLDDATGEPLAVLLKALSLASDQARQVLLLSSPVGRDPAAFFPLCDLYAGMLPTVATTLAEAWRRKPASEVGLPPQPLHTRIRERDREPDETMRPGRQERTAGRAAEGRG
ncbi:MAG: hypothetical protein KDJ86_05265 [Bauldia sp.]|uniref:hypothetical protein n=1 Tax=Bauldia sp. TaxID=2575872 RepID=UPI001E059561|nr:hypothetical protein [Bauldia sp.]MCB1495175.1 hypothetical protein [Bauldia sp.]